MTSLYSIDKAEVRQRARESLTERAQYVLKNIGSVIAEGYTDSPGSIAHTEPKYTPQDVMAMLNSWNNDYSVKAEDPYYNSNYKNSIHGKSDKEKEAEKENSDKEQLKNESGIPSTESTKHLMRAMYFLESADDVPVDYIDVTDEDFTDDIMFLEKLEIARTNNEDIEFQLEDGNFVTLDVEHINKLIHDDVLRNNLMQVGLRSIYSFTQILDIPLEDDKNFHDELTEDEDNLEFESLEEEWKAHIHDLMYQKADNALANIFEDIYSESTDIQKLANKLAKMQKTKNNKNKQKRGKLAMVNRVRGGKLQMRKMVSDTKGFKVKNGVAVRMKPSEIKKRRISARFASKKRRNKQSLINRHRKISMRLRNRRLGN